MIFPDDLRTADTLADADPADLSPAGRRARREHRQARADARRRARVGPHAGAAARLARWLRRLVRLRIRAALDERDDRALCAAGLTRADLTAGL